MSKLPDAEVRESVIEDYLLRRLRSLGHRRTLVKKISGPGWRGWPDRMVLYDDDAQDYGCTHWIELKRPKGGKFEPLQERRHEKLRGMGFVVRVLNTKAKVDGYIDEVSLYGPHNVPRQ